MSLDRYKVFTALYMTGILALSSIPGATGADAPGASGVWIPPILSNALHVPIYAGLAWLCAHALLRNGQMSARRVGLVALAIAVLFGAIDELYQGLIPGRTTAFGDWLADTAGAALGLWFFFAIRQRSRRR